MPQIIVASGPVIVENNKVLLNIDLKDNFWKFCGGRVEEFDLDFKETAIREAREEMGLEIEILNQSPFLFCTEKIIDDKNVSIILIHYLAKRINDVAPGKETFKWTWLDLNELKLVNLAPNIIPTLKYFNFIK